MPAQVVSLVVIGDNLVWEGHASSPTPQPREAQCDPWRSSLIFLQIVCHPALALVIFNVAFMRKRRALAYGALAALVLTLVGLVMLLTMFVHFSMKKPF